MGRLDEELKDMASKVFLGNDRGTRVLLRSHRFRFMQGTVNPRSLQFDPEIEKIARKLRKSANERKAKTSSSTETKEETMADNNAIQNPPRTLGDYMTPARVPQTSSIVRPTVDANNFELKPALLQLIQKEQFVGGSIEDLYNHLDDFLLYCDTLKINGVSRDAILLRLFLCSLKEDARAWLQSLPEESITSWDDLARKFLARFFSASKMARLKAEITAFEQKESETLYEAWERFKGLLLKCPQHGIEAWEKWRIFFQGMMPSTRTLVNAAAGGSLKTKIPEEALELLESLAYQEFDNAPISRRRSRIMKLDDYDVILAQNEQILQINKKQQAQLDALTKQFSNSQVSYVNNSQITCGIYAGTHATEDCDYMRTPENTEVNRVWYDQKNQNNLGRNQYGNNYNQGWKNQNQHPGLSYKSNHQPNPPLPMQQQPPPQGNTSEWEKAFAQLSKTTSNYIQNANAFRDETRASHRNLETSVVTRSGIVILPVEKSPVEKKKEVEPAAEEEKEEDAGEDEKKLFKWEKEKGMDRQPKPADTSPYARVPYPQRLKQEVQKQQYTKFLDIFKMLQVNIPFAEALESMPNYAKFMKDLLSKMRKLKECETVALTEECSAIIQKKLPPKLKDPGSFSIPIAIGNIEVGKALCDLGASINLMPLSMCKALVIRELKPTTISLQLADRSIRRSDGVIEDVLVKIDKFIFPADFVILNMEEDAEIPLLQTI
ncbi:uncharacterized protein LOC133313906 [Gastrolobium bilobum]|uniref:uncharacterized protein LOC133313906 n=1 Tax=Gastrolobium bilobum TaxID=150636 RepID=UPI002AB05AA5|nr:uncharacterized protein LOC133313906 [Gastrolobium bilobum]